MEDTLSFERFNITGILSLFSGELIFLMLAEKQSQHIKKNNFLHEEYRFYIWAPFGKRKAY